MKSLTFFSNYNFENISFFYYGPNLDLIKRDKPWFFYYFFIKEKILYFNDFE